MSLYGFIFKCPTCVGGPDQICSDGYCYPAGNACPIGTRQMSNKTCTCAEKCVNGSKSLLSVFIFSLN